MTQTVSDESFAAVEAYLALRECYVNTYRCYCLKHQTGVDAYQAEQRAESLMDAFFKKNQFDARTATRSALEAIANQLNTEMGLLDDPDLLEDHNVTLHLFISDLPESITVL